MGKLLINFEDFLIIIDGMGALLVIDGMRTLILLYLQFNQRLLAYLALSLWLQLLLAECIFIPLLLIAPLQSLIMTRLHRASTAVELVALGPLADLEFDTLLLFRISPFLIF